MSKEADRVKQIFVSLMIGFSFGVITYLCFSEEGIYSQVYSTMLSTAWIVFAGWLPMMVLTLSILISTSDRVLIRVLLSTGHLPFFINNIALCTISILLTAVLLFAHGVMENPSFLYTFVCTSAVAATISYFGHIFYSIMQIGKNLPKADKAKTASNK